MTDVSKPKHSTYPKSTQKKCLCWLSTRRGLLVFETRSTISAGNPLAFKLNATQPEKDYLIEIGKLGPHLRTRSVTLITARSVYNLHGGKMFIGVWLVLIYVAFPS